MHSLDLAIEAREASVFGIDEQATIDLKRAQEWKGKVIGRLESGILEMLKESDVDVMEGICSFQSSTTSIVKGSHGSQHIEFKRAVIATGSHFRMPEGIHMDGMRVTNPYGLTQLDKAPHQVVVPGAGLGGLTTASLLAKTGSEVTLVFKGKTPVRAVDDDILQPALQWLEKNKVRLVPRATWQVAPDGVSVKILTKAGAEELKPEQVIFASP
jgi:dihydrolipoamide dehydrogenase